MSDNRPISLDNPALNGRFRQFNRGQPVGRNLPPRPSNRYVNGVVTHLKPRAPVVPEKLDPIASISPPNLLKKPIKFEPELRRSTNKHLIVIKAEMLSRRQEQVIRIRAKRRHLGYLALKSKKRFRFNLSRLSSLSKMQYAAFGMGLFIFVFGLVITVQTLITNHNASAQVQALSKSANISPSSSSADDTSSSPVPSTVKPTPVAVASYAVAPNLPKYINIPKLDVHARVLQVGVLASGALGTPNNVYDAAWYTGSAEPGQPGATLIDGHVSSWTTKGVFYGIHNLVAGDKIQIITGANLTLNYQVESTVTYPSGNVDMSKAIAPVTPGVSGLNLITCTGKVIKGTSQFNQRVIVYAQQV